MSQPLNPDEVLVILDDIRKAITLQKNFRAMGKHDRIADALLCLSQVMAYYAVLAEEEARTCHPVS